MAKWEFAVKSREEIRERGLSAWYAILINGKDSYTGKTAADYEAENLIVLSESEFDELNAAHEDSMCGHWKEITEEQYEYALNVLPPKKWDNGGFFMGECFSGSLYDFYQRINGKFYTSLQSIYTPRTEILDSLNTYLAA